MRLRGMLDQAELKLVTGGLAKGDAAALLEPARRLAADENFWLQQDEGLALFIAPGFLRSYQLPLNLQEQLVLDDYAHLRPLLPLLADDQKFFVLALSEKEIRLLRCTESGCLTEPLADAPQSLAQNEQFSQRERYLGFYSRGSGSQARFYGQSDASSREELAQEHFALRVAQALDTELNGEKAPLVIAGTQELAHMLRQRLSYPHIAAGIVAGNPEHLSAEELQRCALPLVAEQLGLPRRQALEKLHAGLGTGRAEAQRLPLVQAALDGRVETLFVTPAGQIRGRIDMDSRQALPELPGGPALEADLLELALASTLRQGGRAYLAQPEELPGEAEAAALLRY
ncbi:hypothetical protein IT575_11765 [bacterium]|nr:hypothetical protein [bacterium]